MVFIVIPFLKSNIVVWSNILKYLFRPAGNTIIKNLSTILNHKNKMILQ